MAGAEQGQLIVDDFLKLGLRLRSAQKDPVNEESGGTGNADLLSLFYVGCCFRLSGTLMNE